MRSAESTQIVAERVSVNLRNLRIRGYFRARASSMTTLYSGSSAAVVRCSEMTALR